MNTSTLKPPVDTSEILNEWQKEILSSEAQKAYTAIWLRMNSLHATEIHLTDEQLSHRARVVLPKIHAAKMELQRAGLLHLSPFGVKTRYEFIEEDEAGQ
jgi:hypothetical protein